MKVLAVTPVLVELVVVGSVVVVVVVVVLGSVKQPGKHALRRYVS